MVNGLIGPFRACRVCVCLLEVFNELPAVIGRTVIMGDKCTANRYGDRYIYIITIVNAIHLKLIYPFAFINLQVVRTATREKVKNGAKYCNFHTYRSAST